MTICETAITLLHIFTQSDVYDGLFGDAMEQIIKERSQTNQLFSKLINSHPGKEYVTIQSGIARGEQDAPTTQPNYRPTHCPLWDVGTVQVHPKGF